MAKRRKQQRAALVPYQRRVPLLNGVDGGGNGSWLTVFSGHHDNGWWQKDIHYTASDAHRNATVFACMTLIAGDISKLQVMLVEKKSGVWQETDSPPYRNFLRAPNGFQTWQQFIEYWQLSKQSSGNTYVLLDRDASTRVRRAYVLDPCRVTPKVAPNGDVFYGLKADDLAGVPQGDGGEVIVPASEIMHDRFNCLFHPLVGLSPLYASALAAAQGLTIQEKSRSFFANNSRPGGILTSPSVITETQAAAYRKSWRDTYGEGGTNAGGTAVLGNGLTYAPIAVNAVDADLVKQMDMTDVAICRAFHVPPFKVAVGATPTYSAESMNRIYYDDCLQTLIEAIESILDQGLELDDVDGRHLRAQFDLDGLLRMDNRTLISAMAEGVKGGIFAPDEGRSRLNLPPVDGGDTVYLQQQNFSLAALAKRDAQDDPFGTNAPAAAAPPKPGSEPAAANDDDAADEAAVKFFDVLRKGLDHAAA